MRLETPEQIIQFAETIQTKLVDQELDHLDTDVDYVVNPLLLIQKGFLPVRPYDPHDPNLTVRELDTLLRNAVEAYVYGYTPEESLFWFETNLDWELQRYTYITWRYATIKYWMDKAQKTADSLPLLLYAPNEVYLTKRPKTDMLMFKNPDMSHQPPPTKYHIPVTRYAQGMSRGLYYLDGDREEYCGTFYYFEPESDVQLGYNTFLKFPNKWAARGYFLNIPGLPSEDELSKYRGWISDEMDYWTGYSNIPPDLMMTPLEALDIIDNVVYRSELLSVYTTEFASKLPQTRRYAGQITKLYGYEDLLDQDICRWARKLGIEILIFEFMVGSHQIVTEILDTRDRKTSFDNLNYPS